MRAHLYILAGLMIAGAGPACDTSNDAESRLAFCLELNEGDCPDDEVTDPSGGVCGYRTETQDTWGSACSGNEPACFRDDHFLDVFPEGLYVGCGEYTATVLNAAAVEGALMTSGTPRALLKTEAVAYDGVDDPVVGTALFGELVALALNIEFDNLPGYAEADPATPLRDLVLAEGPCIGFTVGQVFEEANLVLGGCPSALTPADADTCVAAINASFVPTTSSCKDKDKDKDKVKCEEEAASTCSSLFAAP